MAAAGDASRCCCLLLSANELLPLLPWPPKVAVVCFLSSAIGLEYEGVDGFGLWSEAQARNPNLKVVYTSGYSEDFASDGNELGETPAVLRKPYDPDELLQVLRDTLARGT